MRSFAVPVILSAAVAVLAAGQPAPLLVITGATIIPGDGTASRVGNVVVSDGLITGISPAGPPPAGATVIDGTGRFLIPGLWDMHVHLATRPEPMIAEQMMLPLFLAHGDRGRARHGRTARTRGRPRDLRSAADSCRAPGS